MFQKKGYLTQLLMRWCSMAFSCVTPHSRLMEKHVALFDVSLSKTTYVRSMITRETREEKNNNSKSTRTNDRARWDFGWDWFFWRENRVVEGVSLGVPRSRQRYRRLFDAPPANQKPASDSGLPWESTLLLCFTILEYIFTLNIRLFFESNVRCWLHATLYLCNF